MPSGFMPLTIFLWLVLLLFGVLRLAFPQVFTVFPFSVVYDPSTNTLTFTEEHAMILTVVAAIMLAFDWMRSR